MGMRWYYNLTTSADRSKEVEIIAEFRNTCEDANYALDEYGSSQTDSSWQSEEQDFKALSKKYPDVLFTVHRDGTSNSSDDLAYIYYKNGKMQECHATITYEEFSESELK